VRNRLAARVAAGTVAALAALLVLSGCGGGSQEGPVSDVSVHDSDGINGVVLPQAYRSPDVDLRDTGGASYDLATDAKKPLTLVFFGYTNCPDVCQLVMANLASALVRLDPSHRKQVGVVFVTTDPRRDTSSVLRSYLDRFNPAFEGLTGPLPAIVRAGKAFDIPIEKGHKLASGGYDVAHGTQVVGLKPDGTAPYVWTQGTTPGQLADDLTAILDDKVPAT
jgi:protein SCO1/2